MNRAYKVGLPAPQTAILALLVEVERAAGGCHAWVTVQRLAQWSGMSQSGVRDQLAALTRAGHVDKRAAAGRRAALFRAIPGGRQ